MCGSYPAAHRLGSRTEKPGLCEDMVAQNLTIIILPYTDGKLRWVNPSGFPPFCICIILCALCACMVI